MFGARLHFSAASVLDLMCKAHEQQWSKWGFVNRSLVVGSDLVWSVSYEPSPEIQVLAHSSRFKVTWTNLRADPAFMVNFAYVLCRTLLP